ncbi:MAG: hypothetical protein RBU29_05370, partial [bacterium]|nr:hypothetical protein [bacterium]
MAGAQSGGPTPFYLFPFLIVLGGLTLYRQSEAAPRFGFSLIWLPTAIAILTALFCLLNEMKGVFWGFRVPGMFPIWVRVVWVQGMLLLLHPPIFPPVQSFIHNIACRLHQRGYGGWKVLLPLAAVAMGMWLLRSQNVYSDGYDWIQHSFVPGNWTRYLREPLSVLLLRVSVVVTGWEPYLAITVVMIGAGLITFILMARIVRFALPPPYAGFTYALLVSSAGFTQLFFGNIEIYGLLQLGTACFIHAVFRYWQDDWAAWRVGAAYALLLCLHLSAAWWGLCFLAIPLVKRYSQEKPVCVTWDSVQMSLTTAGLGVLFALYIASVGHDGSLVQLWRHFTSVQVLYVGSDAAMFHPWQTYLTGAYYLTQINEFFFLMPGLFVLLPVILAAWKHRGRVTLQQAWFLAMAGFYCLYALVWHADRPIVKDWDLFSGLTIPMALS